VKLTGTNSSIVLIVLINPCPPQKGETWTTVGQINKEPEFTKVFFADPVVIARVPKPDPIPNSTVKTLCADDTKSQGLGK
jgi:hypothetical protein